MVKRMKELEGRVLVRSAAEMGLPKLSTKDTVGHSANTVDNTLFRAPIAPKALLRNVPRWAQVVAEGEIEKS